MITIRNTNERYGAPQTFTAETEHDAIDQMEKSIRDCGPEFVGVVVGPDDYEVLNTEELIQ